MKSLILTISVFLLLTATVLAQIPQTMSYQGVLTDANGNPVPDGNVALKFRLYDAANGGTPIWEETQSVSVVKGIFNTILGSVTPLNLPFDKPYWLGITVGNGTELAPRIALTASPYSLNSHSTIVEPQPGQGITIRDASGAATHQISADGNVTHSGIGIFRRGIVVGDTIIVPPDTLGAGTAVLNKGANAADLPAIGFQGGGTDIGVFGFSLGKGRGVVGQSTSGAGVHGISETGPGVVGNAKNNFGVYGKAENFHGVFGDSEKFDGVRGVSRSAVRAGVSGYNGSGGPGVIAQGNPAIHANGTVKIDNVPLAPDQNRFLVWDGDNIVKFRTTAFNGVLNNTALRILNAGGVEVFRVNPDGTSYHGGLETFAGGIQITGAGNGIFFPDGTKQITAGGGAFDGTLVNKALILKDAAGNEVFRVNPDGASFHKGVETFDDDVLFKGTGGKGAKLVDANGQTIAGFGRLDLGTGQRLGVYGKAEKPGDLAGAFDGNVDVDGEIYASSFHLVNANGDTLMNFNADGTSYHSGLETFAGGILARGKALLGEDFIFVGAKNLNETSQALKNAGRTTGPNVLFFAKDSTGEDTAGLFSSVSGERPSVYAEKRPPGSNFSSAAAMNEHLQNLNQITAPAKINLSPDFSQFLSQQNLPSIWGVTSMADNEAVLGQNSSTTSTSAAMRGVHIGRGVGVVGQIANSASTAPAVWGLTNGIGSGVSSTVTGNGTGLLVDHNGATGHLAVFRRNGANQIRFDLTGKGFFNGGTQIGGADVAEAFEVEGTVQQYEPGDVLVISTNADRKLEKSAAPYSTLVAGVYATKPGVLLTERSIDDPHDDTVPLGVVGVIPTKVCGENGPIRRGDLLVTSSLPGHAMKGTERERMLGAVLGKALENFDTEGKGMIKVLVNVK
jgi:hypothetical protein